MARKQTHNWDEVFGSAKSGTEDAKAKVPLTEKVAGCLKKIWKWLCNMFI